MASVNAPLDAGRPPALLDGAIFRETIVSAGAAVPELLLDIPLPVAYTRWVLLSVAAMAFAADGNTADLLVTVPDGEGSRRLLRASGPYDNSLGTTRPYAINSLTGLAFWSFTYGGAEALIHLYADTSVAGAPDATIFNLTWKLEYSSSPPASNGSA